MDQWFSDIETRVSTEKPCFFSIWGTCWCYLETMFFMIFLRATLREIPPTRKSGSHNPDDLGGWSMRDQDWPLEQIDMLNLPQESERIKKLTHKEDCKLKRETWLGASLKKKGSLSQLKSHKKWNHQLPPVLLLNTYSCIQVITCWLPSKLCLAGLRRKSTKYFLMTWKKTKIRGSKPIITLFGGMNIHKSQLFWCENPGILILMDFIGWLTKFTIWPRRCQRASACRKHCHGLGTTAKWWGKLMEYLPTFHTIKHSDVGKYV